jgi:hypothetical protein
LGGIVEEGGIHAPIVLSHLISGPAIQPALIYVKTREFGAKPNSPANEADDWFRFRGKSGHASDITAMTEFGPRAVIARHRAAAISGA